MKCKNCDGTGIVPYRDGNGNIVKEMGLFECPFCNKGEIKVTNEQWLRLCTTEQLAEALLNIMANNEFTLYLLHTEKKSVQEIKGAVVEWLKQPHSIKE